MDYALYYGDKFIDLGTKEYLAKKLNVKVSTISFYQRKKKKKRTNYQSWIVIKIEED